MEFIIWTLSCLTIGLLWYTNYLYTKSNEHFTIVQNQKREIENQKREIRDQKIEILNQKRELQNLKNEYKATCYPDDIEKKKAQLKYALEKKSLY